MCEGGDVYVCVCVHECTCMHKPKHNDNSAITEVIKTQADLYQCRQRGSRKLILLQGKIATLDQSFTPK